MVDVRDVCGTIGGWNNRLVDTHTTGAVTMSTTTTIAIHINGINESPIYIPKSYPMVVLMHFGEYSTLHILTTRRCANDGCWVPQDNRSICQPSRNHAILQVCVCVCSADHVWHTQHQSTITTIPARRHPCLQYPMRDG